MAEPATDEEIAAYRKGIERGSLKSATPNVVRSLIARIEAEKADAESVRNSLRRCLDAMSQFDTTNYDDYGGPHLADGIGKLGKERDAEKARADGLAVKFANSKERVEKLGKRISELERENEKLIDRNAELLGKLLQKTSGEEEKT